MLEGPAVRTLLPREVLSKGDWRRKRAGGKSKYGTVSLLNVHLGRASDSRGGAAGPLRGPHWAAKPAGAVDSRCFVLRGGEAGVYARPGSAPGAYSDWGSMASDVGAS